MTEPATVVVDDIAGRKFALRDYSRTAYERALKRFEWLELKSHRYFAVLTFMVGSASVGLLPEVARVFKDVPHAWSVWVFLAFVSAFLCAAVWAMFAALHSSRLEKIPAPSSDPGPVVEAFLGQTAPEAAHGEALQNMNSTADLLAICERRATSLSRAYLMMIWSLSLYLCTLAIWIVGRFFLWK
jgi:hypothetical protein